MNIMRNIISVIERKYGAGTFYKIKYVRREYDLNMPV